MRTLDFTIEKSFVRDIKTAANGDGSKEAMMEFRAKARKAVRQLSTPNIREEFYKAIKEYGRAVVGVCLAVTIDSRRDQLQAKTVKWGDEVLRLWKNRPIIYLSSAYMMGCIRRELRNMLGILWN